MLLFLDVYELSLPQSLLSLKRTVENFIEENRLLRKYTSQSHVAVIIGYSNMISDTDYDKAKSVLSSIKSLNPGQYFKLM